METLKLVAHRFIVNEEGFVYHNRIVFQAIFILAIGVLITHFADIKTFLSTYF